MKLSELSYREYIALEVFPGFIGSMPDDEAAWRAFGAADAFLKRCGKEHDRVAQAEFRATQAENTLSVLMGLDNDFAPRAALLQLWELLDAKDQTSAVIKLRELLKSETKND